MDGNFLQAFYKMIVILVLITCAIFVLLYLLKRFRLKALSLKKVAQIRLVSRLHLSPKKFIALVEVSGQWLVLGVGSDSITLLTKLEHPPEADFSGESDYHGGERMAGESEIDSA